MFKVINKRNNEEYTVNRDRITTVLLDLCGGGYTAKQTARAMECLHRLRNGKKVTINRFVEIKPFTTRATVKKKVEA